MAKINLNNEFFVQGVRDGIKEAAKKITFLGEVKNALSGSGKNLLDKADKFIINLKNNPGKVVGEALPKVGLGAAGLYGAKKLVQHWSRQENEKENR
jgi:hypothetical protein